MGIKDINKVIGSYAKQVNLKKYQGKTVGVDVMNWMYRFLRSPGYAYHERPILKGFMNQITAFTKNGVTPFYVFDGEASEEKSGTIEKRKEAQNSLGNRLSTYEDELIKRNLNDVILINNDSGDINIEDKEPINLDQIVNEEVGESGVGEEGDEIVNIYEDVMNGNALENMTDDDLKKKITTMKMQSRNPTYKDIKLCKKLFNFMNVKYIHAPGEADEILASLEKHGMINAVLSADMDMLTYGTSCLLNEMKSSGKQGYTCKEYVLSDILSDFNWTHAQFVDFCILCGCDYVDRIPKLGVKTAKKFIDTHFTIENVVASLYRKKKSTMKVPEGYLEKVNKARNIFSLTKLHSSLNSSNQEKNTNDLQNEVNEVINDVVNEVVNEEPTTNVGVQNEIDNEHKTDEENRENDDNREHTNGEENDNVDNDVEEENEIDIGSIWLKLAKSNIKVYTAEEKQLYFEKYDLPNSVPVKTENAKKSVQKGQMQITKFLKK